MNANHTAKNKTVPPSSDVRFQQKNTEKITNSSDQNNEVCAGHPPKAHATKMVLNTIKTPIIKKAVRSAEVREFMAKMKKKNIPLCRFSNTSYMVNTPYLKATFTFFPFGEVLIAPIPFLGNTHSLKRLHFFTVTVHVSSFEELMRKCAKHHIIHERDLDRYFKECKK